MLVTFDVPVRADAAAIAVDTAVESGQPLLLVNVVELPIRPMTLVGLRVVVLEDVERRSASPRSSRLARRPRRAPARRQPAP